jgi:hypothetical protein
MVDFALVLRPGLSHKDDDQALQDKMQKLVLALPKPVSTINQATHPSLRFFPLAVAIETKTDASSLLEASFQLCVWTAAWHVRMKRLLQLGGRVGPGEKAKVITVPLVTVQDGRWTLTFAVDQGSEIVSPRLLSSRRFAPFYFLYLVQYVLCNTPPVKVLTALP